MWFGAGKKSAPAARTRKRQEDRFASDLLVCELGDVVDLSGSGIRLRCKGKGKFAKGQVLPLTLRVPEGQLTLRSRVVRVERRGLLAYEVGLEFVGITPTVARALKCLARYGFVTPVESSGGAAHAQEKQPWVGTIGVSGAQAVLVAAKIRKARELLQVGEFATAEELQRAYRKLALTCHPDVKPGPGADERFAEIVQAYRTLRSAMRTGVAT